MKSTTDLQEARSRLLHSAEAVFARLGYTAATTREICRLAHSNRGAVNYHFRDKLGLYKEVLEGLVRAETSPLNDRSLFDLPPEKALAKFIVGMMSNLADLGSPDHYTKLMLHELAAPAEGLQVVVDTILRPRVLVLCEIVGRLIGKSARHKRTRMCVHSIIGQVSHYVQSTHVIALLWPDWKLNATVRAEIAEHVTEFSFLALSAIKRRHDNKAVKTVGVG